MRLSLGSCGRLGLVRCNQTVLPTTCYALIGDRCSKGCSFCSQSVASDALSRIEWPEFDDDIAIDAINGSHFSRVCLQCTDGALHKAAGLIERFTKPVSISHDFRNIAEVASCRSADRICIPLDAADKALHRKHKHADFDSELDLIRHASELFPGKITTHLIVGLGETEDEFVALMESLVASGVEIGLFAFTPIKGTELERNPQPDMRLYRRMQAALHEMRHGTVRPEAFRTSGCPGCNRPFYNERPGGPIYNYPRPLSGEEYRVALDLGQ